jgi:hypothetical protein
MSLARSTDHQPCERCQRNQEALNCYATDLVAADQRIQDLEIERNDYYAMVSVLMDRLHQMTKAQEYQAARIKKLVGQLEGLQSSQRRAA